ncbi:hypothetical protein [Streptomyces californicus]|uniref:hypothetical protein n=1 Tax=Streptomyces californicus TaxID=67351 RepID=UPI00296E4029|nr:hypothetical protein [Streptomyces californicus]MDW4912620.1 hypothetical protein [Streptomyces californicus]
MTRHHDPAGPRPASATDIECSLVITGGPTINFVWAWKHPWPPTGTILFDCPGATLRVRVTDTGWRADSKGLTPTLSLVATLPRHVPLTDLMTHLQALRYLNRVELLAEDD